MARNVDLVARLIADASQFKRGMDEASMSAKQGEQKLRSMGRGMENLGRNLTRSVTLPLLAIGAAAVKTFTDFDGEMTKIQALVGGTADEIDMMSEAVKGIAVATGRGPQELAEALYFARSAGLDARNALDAVEWSAKAAAAGLGDTATIVDLVTSAMNAYGSETLSAQQATDTLTAAVRLGKLAPEELAGAMGRVLPIASAMGVEFDEVAAAMAAMSRTGTNAAEGATQLRGIFAQLLRGSQQTRDGLGEVGLSMEMVQTQLREEGLLATLETLVDAFDGNAAATNKVFGNVRALTGVMDLLGGNAEATREVFADITDVVGETDRAFEVMSQTAGFKFQQALAELQVALIDIGAILAPFAVEFMQMISGVASAFSALPRPIQNVVVALGALAAAIGPVLMISGRLIQSWVMLGGTAPKLASQLGVLAAVAPKLLLFVAVGKALEGIFPRSYDSGDVEDLSSALRDLGDTGRVSGEAARLFGGDLDTLSSSIEAIAAPSNVTRIKHGIDSIYNALPGPDAHSDLDDARAKIEGLDDALSQLAMQDPFAASEALRQIREQIGDDAFDRLEPMLEGYYSVLGDVETQSEMTARMTEELEEAMTEAAAATEGVVVSFGRWGVALDENGNAVEEWQAGIAASMDSAQDAMWSFSDEAKKSLGAFRDEAFDNLEKFRAWKDNIVRVAERGGVELAAEWAKLGPEYAGVLDELVNASDEEFAEIAFIMGAYGAEGRSDLMSEIGAAAGDVPAAVAGIETAMNTALWGVARAMGTAGEHVGASLGYGIERGVRRTAGAIAESARSVVNFAVSEARRAAEIQSPSRLFAREVGEPITEGVAQGMLRARREIPDALGTLLRDPAIASSYTSDRAVASSGIDYERLAAAVADAVSQVRVTGDVSLDGRTVGEVVSERLRAIERSRR